MQLPKQTFQFWYFVSQSVKQWYCYEARFVYPNLCNVFLHI